jgi:hypothetical protein
MKKIFLALMAGVMLVSCDLNFFPSDETNSDVLLQDPSGAEYIMDGCYAVLKDEVEFLGYSSGNTFARHYFQMSEFPADNACLSAHTTDDLYQATALVMTDNLKNVGTLWMLAYKVIFMTNSVIENNEEGVSPESDHLLGEAYFVRGWMHLNLVTLFSKPYVQGPNNIGIPLHISTNNPKVTRAKVGDVYDQIVKDLEKAESLMNVKSRGNKGYPSKLTAQGILSRVHLYMGNWEACVKVVDAMLGGKAAADMLDKDFANYFVKAKTSEETLFCIAHEATDTRGQSSIGSMYLKDEIGWGEIYPSYPLMYLYERYPQDLRYTSYIHTQYAGDGNWKVYFPVAAQTGGISEGRANEICAATPDGENFKFTYDGATYTAEKRTIQGEYFEYWVKYKNEDIQVRVDTTITHRKTIPTVYISKFSYQDGDPMLSSPVICRWGEVILNRAEAYAKLGQDAKALEDVNVIRTRAGIPTEGMFAADKMHGYTSALDVVLDERRLELAFEGHRLFDLIRNEKKIDRKFPGAQPWEIVEPTDNRLQYPIPNSEWSVSGIEQNPGY